MTPQDAELIVHFLSGKFPDSAPNEGDSVLYQADLMLLADRRVAARASRQLATTADRFPSIADFRRVYRQLAEAPPSDSDSANGMPEWVRVWGWQLERTQLERQEANAAQERVPAERRSPVRLRDFPQFPNPGPDAYSMDEYEQIRQEWLQAASP